MYKCYTSLAARERDNVIKHKEAAERHANGSAGSAFSMFLPTDVRQTHPRRRRLDAPRVLPVRLRGQIALVADHELLAL
jgi:hypothetical protein